MRRLLIATALSLAATACSSDRNDPAAPPPTLDTARVALTDLGARMYQGFAGGLYPGGSNQVPADHASHGRVAATQVVPLAADGQPSGTGKIVLLSVGMSNTTMEFCNGAYPRCGTASFIGQARLDPQVDTTRLVLVDGARGGQTPPSWLPASAAQYDSARARLTAAHVTESQVQVAWIKQADAGPKISLPNPGADAFVLEKELGDLVRALKVRYPNLRQVFLSSRIYAGYASTQLNPEPYAYETGFAVKWLIEAQIQQNLPGGLLDARAGDLKYDAQPWLAWGPYLWAAGAKARSDGLTWLPSEYAADGTHPNGTADLKVGRMLLDFFKTSPFTSCWFLAGQRCT
ncbi:MAG TPA: hypothetical protein VF832_14985 [Longimicrobiales bacterium]